MKLHQKLNVAKNENFYNLAQSTSEYFTTGNNISAKNVKTGKNVICTKEEFKNNDDLVGVVKGVLSVIDKETNKHVRISKEEYQKNKNKYTSLNFGKVIAKNVKI